MLALSGFGDTSEGEELGSIRVEGAELESEHWGAVYVLRRCAACSDPTEEEMNGPAIQATLIRGYRADPDAETITVDVTLLAGSEFRTQLDSGVHQNINVVHPFNTRQYAEDTGPATQELSASMTFDWEEGRCEAVVPVNITMGANTWGSTLLWKNGITLVGTIQITLLVLPAQASLILNPAEEPALDTWPLLVRRDSVGLSFGLRGCGIHPYLQLESLALDGSPLDEVPYPFDATFGPAVEAGSYTTIRTQPTGELLIPAGTVGIDARTWAVNLYGCCRGSSSATLAFPEGMAAGRHRLAVTFKPVDIVPSPLTIEQEFIVFGPAIVLSDEELSPGETFEMEGTGFPPASRVTVYAKVRPFTGQEREIELGEAHTALDGGFVEIFTLPNASADFWADLSSWRMTPAQPQLGMIRVIIMDDEFHQNFDHLDSELEYCRVDIFPQGSATGDCLFKIGLIQEIEFIKPE